MTDFVHQRHSCGTSLDCLSIIISAAMVIGVNRDNWTAMPHSLNHIDCIPSPHGINFTEKRCGKTTIISPHHRYWLATVNNTKFRELNCIEVCLWATPDTLTAYNTRLSGNYHRMNDICDFENNCAKEETNTGYRTRLLYHTPVDCPRIGLPSRHHIATDCSSAE